MEKKEITQLPLSKHIFLQLDTTNIINEVGAKKIMPPAEINEIAISNCLLYEQGSMILGDPIKYFSINVEQNQEVFFTILPLQLFSKHRLYFTDDAFSPEGKQYIPIKIEKPGGQFVSFKITIDADAPNGHYESFSLNFNLEYQKGNETVTIPATIDPMLRVLQP